MLVKALSVDKEWVCGELKKCGNVELVVDWNKKKINQIFPSTKCEDVGAKIKSEQPIFVNDVYKCEKGEFCVIGTTKGAEPIVKCRRLGMANNLRIVPYNEFKKYEYTGRNVLNKSAMKNEKFDSDTIARLYDVKMAKALKKYFSHYVSTTAQTIEGNNTLSYNILPYLNKKNGRLVMFSSYGCLDIPRNILLSFVKELIDICEVYFNPQSPFDFSVFESERLDTANTIEKM